MPHVFQDQFPAVEAQQIASAVLSKTFTKAMIRQAWVVAEYGISIITPVATGAGEESLEIPELPHCSDQEAMERLLEAATNGELEGVPSTFLPLPWGVIFSVILQAIMALI